MPLGKEDVELDPKDNVDYDIVEEGSEEERAGRKAAERDDDADETDDAPDDRTLTNLSDDEQAERIDGSQPSNAERRRSRRKRLKDKLDEKDAIIESTRQQLRDAMARIGGIEQRTTNQERIMLDKVIVDAKETLRMARDAHATSLTQQDPHAVTEAMDAYAEAKQRVQELEGIKRQVERTPAIQHQNLPDPSVTQKTTAWMDRNRWFDPSGNGTDSRICKQLDNEVAEAGFNPGTDAYWRELDRRVKKYLPHRFKGKTQVADDDDGDDEMQDVEDRKDTVRREPRQTVSSSGQSEGSGGNRVKVTLSRERVQAIKDAGMWEDPEKRKAMVKSYIDYDKANPPQAR